MAIKYAGFDWDNGNWPKCGKHGVTKDEIEAFFQFTPSVMPDPHPDEPRMRAIGKSKAGRYLFLVFRFQSVEGQILIRPISARYMHQKEIDHYEKTRLQIDASPEE
jgi:uncharacterized DUF497 family protein